MLFKLPVLGLLASLFSLSQAEHLDASYLGPRSVGEYRRHFPYHHPPKDHRRKVHIRNSRSDTDDISSEFLKGLKKANHGGTLVLPAGKTFVIGKKLDLTFLNDVQVQLDGEILFTDDIDYWQNNYFSHPFQKSITFWKWGGKDIRIFGTGTLNGNGQAWYDGFAGKEVLVSIRTAFDMIGIVLMSYRTQLMPTSAPSSSTPRTPQTSTSRAFALPARRFGRTSS